MLCSSALWLTSQGVYYATTVCFPYLALFPGGGVSKEPVTGTREGSLPTRGTNNGTAGGTSGAGEGSDGRASEVGEGKDVAACDDRGGEWGESKGRPAIRRRGDGPTGLY